MLGYSSESLDAAGRPDVSRKYKRDMLQPTEAEAIALAVLECLQGPQPLHHMKCTKCECREIGPSKQLGPCRDRRCDGSFRRIQTDLAGSVGWWRANADDGSRGDTLSSRRHGQPLRAETQVAGTAAVGETSVWSGGVIKPGYDYESGISLLTPKVRGGVSVVQPPDRWEDIEVTVDSGACVTVMPRSMCEGISILQNALSQEGAEYEVANGAAIPNLGERRCEVMTVGSVAPKKITFQVADVHKPLLSITACADMGFDCYLGKEGGSLRDRVTGEVIPLNRKGTLYTMKMWVRQDPTIRVSQPFVGPG